MDENRPPRGRAKGRTRISTQNLVGPPPVEVEPVGEQYQGMVLDDGGNGNGNGGNGNGNGSHDRGSPNGGGRRRRSSDEEMPGQQRALDLPQFGRGFQLVRTRPEGLIKAGTSGTLVKLISNYFTLQIRKTVTFRLYKVTFHPEIDHIKKRKALLRAKEPELGPYLFEGTQIFTTRQYEPADCSLRVWFPDKPEESWDVKIEYVRDCLKSEPVTSQLFNVLLKKAQEQLELTLLGRYYFDSSHRIDITNHRLQLWPGFVTSMRQMESEVLLNVDLTFKVCRTDDVFKLMKQIRNTNPNNYKQNCETAIVGSVVMTTYNKKTYKITSIDWNTKPSDVFPITRNKVTEDISFINYFAKKGVQIITPNQPMLISAATKRDIRRGDTGDKILPPEICFQTGLNDEMRANFRIMKDIGQHLHMQPQNRLAQTIGFVDRVIKNPNVNTEFMRWGMRFLTNNENSAVPVELSGRILPSEELKFQSSTVKTNEQADWTMAFRNNLMLLSKPLKNWAILFTGQDADGIGNLISVMQRVSRPLGFNIPMPSSQIRLADGSINSYKGKIDQIVAQFQGQIDIIVIILPTNRLDVYAAVKKSCSLQYGIPSQCFLSKNVNNPKGLMSVCTKLVIQMNAKVGGQPWGLTNPLKGLMVLGFDVHHGGGRSFGAMTATTSMNLASYFSTTLSSEPGVEMSSEVGNCLAKCLYAYRQANGEYPSRIMFYRDGVGEGQLVYVVESEVVALKKTIEKIYGDATHPKFSMIVVTKRINTRLFLQTGPNKFENPRPGTVVDDRITCPEKYDFFLVPQTARQGTVSPVGYNVIADSSGLDADKMQRFSFKLCHGYFNWSGTVAVPAPCQYAHKLAFLTGTALLDEANEKLLNNLHYL